MARGMYLASALLAKEGNRIALSGPPHPDLWIESGAGSFPGGDRKKTAGAMRWRGQESGTVALSEQQAGLAHSKEGVYSLQDLRIGEVSLQQKSLIKPSHWGT